MSKFNHKRTLPILMGLLAGGVLLSPAVVSAMPSQSRVGSTATASPVVRHQVPPEQQSAAAAYWTKERMASAKSRDMVLNSSQAASGSADAAATGTPGAVPPVAANGQPFNTTIRETGAVASAQGFTYPFPFTRTAVSPTSSYTHSARRVNGKIFFVQNGGNFVCSGTVVTSVNRNEVWTAGHCLSDGTSTFNSKTIFVPAYNGNAATTSPYGQWTATSLWVAGDWHTNGNFKRDLGAFTVAPLNGVQIQNRVGAAGFAWNQSRNQQFVDFGYPQSAPFNGASMQNCYAAYGASDPRLSTPGPAASGIGCDMTGGSSGGSWQISWGGGSGASPGLINGHNDYKWDDLPLAMYSPYFDTIANEVRCASQPAGQNGCP